MIILVRLNVDTPPAERRIKKDFLFEHGLGWGFGNSVPVLTSFSCHPYLNRKINDFLVYFYHMFMGM